MKRLRVPEKLSFKWNADPHQAIRCLRFLGRLSAVWPLDENIGRVEHYYQEFGLWSIIINLSISLLTLWKSIYSNYKDPILTAKTVSQFMIISDALTHLILYRIYRSDMRDLFKNMYDFMERSNRDEKFIMKMHYKRFFRLYATLIILYAIASLLFFISAYALRKKFPLDEMYPFSTESSTVTTVIYIHQTFSIIQNAVIIVIDLLVITLLWFAGARFKILGYSLQSIETVEELKKCIIEHQEIFSYVKDTIYTVRFIMYKTVLLVALILISAGIQILYFNARTVMSQFTMVVIVASLRIITFSATIGAIKELNEQLRWIVYKSDTLKISREMNQLIAMIILRCQRPIVIAHGRILKIMSLKFFARFTYTILSHLAALKAIIERST